MVVGRLLILLHHDMSEVPPVLESPAATGGTAGTATATAAASRNAEPAWRRPSPRPATPRATRGVSAPAAGGSTPIVAKQTTSGAERTALPEPATTTAKAPSSSYPAARAAATHKQRAPVLVPPTLEPAQRPTATPPKRPAPASDDSDIEYTGSTPARPRERKRDHDRERDHKPKRERETKSERLPKREPEAKSEHKPKAKVRRVDRQPVPVPAARTRADTPLRELSPAAMPPQVPFVPADNGPRVRGRGCRVLAPAVRRNLLHLLLGGVVGRRAQPLDHVHRVAPHLRLRGWEDVAAHVGARPADVERVRQAAADMMRFHADSIHWEGQP
ncbi:uncharacterized protein LOC62_02G002392 [Vanrija pseudolonga]|uniref:Uncharacterized protein n=1 Tax=Vanrija pseudolonga TaxID=143232 RepID=A0AAF1BJW3_9TREE|nr:hypothetical protein LOC62_02G002392 [Vanrija pseudolonga]